MLMGVEFARVSSNSLNPSHFLSAIEKFSKRKYYLISIFRCVLNVVCFLLGDSPASEFYMPTFRNTIFSIFIGR